jgi:starch synthase
MIPVLLKAHYSCDERYRNIKTVMTIHNLKFQGIHDIDAIRDVCELDDSYFTSEKLEFYGGASMLKGGLVYSDFITTVSKTYSEEIMTDFFGERMDGLLQTRKDCITGIINGIDYDDWNSLKDEYITENYDSRNFVSRKKLNKTALQKEFGLEENPDKFLVGMVTRLTGQKGLDLVECVMDDIMQNDDIQLIVLGTGEKEFEDMLRRYENKYKGKVASLIMFNNAVSHRIYASCDAFLMPSLFEPCGLSQMISMRYGTLPIVRETGGLRDSVEPYNEYENTGTGFSFTNYNAHEMLSTINYAKDVWYNNRKNWNAMVRRAMKTDFSWKNSAKTYIDLYNRL